MVQRTRLIKPEEPYGNQFLDPLVISFRDVYQFQTFGEPVLIIDPTYLADIYNSKDPDATFLRRHGVVLLNFGGDTSGPVWWKAPFVLIPISMHYRAEPQPRADVKVLAQEVGTDSGSFIFLPLTKSLPKSVKSEVEDVLAAGNGAALQLPPGNWSVLYEQWEPHQANMMACFRNIVLEWQDSDM